MKRNSRYFKVFLGKTTSKLPFLKDFGHCPKILDYTLTSLYSKCDQASDPWQQLELASELEIWSTRHCGLGQKMACSFHCWENSTDFVTGLITMVLLMWKWMGLLLRKNHLLRCWGWPSLLNWIRVLTLSLLLKLPPRKLEL